MLESTITIAYDDLHQIITSISLLNDWNLLYLTEKVWDLKYGIIVLKVWDLVRGAIQWINN